MTVTRLAFLFALLISPSFAQSPVPAATAAKDEHQLQTPEPLVTQQSAHRNATYLIATAASARSVPARSKPSKPLPKSDGGDDDPLSRLGFGVALGLRWRTPGQEDIVNDATVDANGIVRVNTRSNTNAGFMLEMHYFLTPRESWPKFGVGPFVGVQAGTDQVVQAVGIGGMFGWKLKEGERKGFGLGAGYAAVPSAKTLGDEFKDGQPAPRGPDGRPLQVRFVQRDQGAVFFMMSFTF